MELISKVVVSQGKIPVLGIPILNKRTMLRTMLSGVDVGMDRLYIIDNGGILEPSDVSEYRADNIHIADPGFNMGVGPAWNFIIRANINADWWMIGCNDMRLESGKLQMMVVDMEFNAGRPHLCRLGMGNEDWGNNFGMFAINPEAIDMIGWFDENIYPIYYEDTDWIARVERAKPHGFTITDIGSETHHIGNASWQDNPHLIASNKRSWDLNRDYHDEKWNAAAEGGDTNGQFDMPFEMMSKEELDGLRYQRQTTVRRLRQQDWHVPREDNVKHDGVLQE